MERFAKIAGYVVLAIMVVACILLILHYAGVIVATSPAWLWGFVWGPPAIVAGGFVLFFVVMAVGDFFSF